MKVRTRTVRGGFGEVAGSHEAEAPAPRYVKRHPRSGDPGFHKWSLDRLETIVRQEGLEARDVQGQIEMFAWDSGYGGVPLSELEWLVGLGRLEGVDVAAEHAAGRAANTESIERLPMDQTCIPSDGEEHVIGDLDVHPITDPGWPSSWEPVIGEQVKPRLAARGYTLGRSIGSGSYAEVFEVEGRRDLVVKVTSDANEAAAIAKINQQGYEGLPALARFFCVYALPSLPVVTREFQSKWVEIPGGRAQAGGQWVETQKTATLFVLVVERLKPILHKVQKALDDHGLALVARTYWRALDPYDAARVTILGMLRVDLGIGDADDAQAAVERRYTLLTKAVPPEQVERLERTLEELARRGILWFDLHGQNVMQDAEGNLKIVDLGVASDLGRRQIEADMPTLSGSTTERLPAKPPADLDRRLEDALLTLHGRRFFEEEAGNLTRAKRLALKNYNRLKKSKTFDIWRGMRLNAEQVAALRPDSTSLGLFWSERKEEIYALAEGGVNCRIHAVAPAASVNLVNSAVKQGWAETEHEIELYPDSPVTILDVEYEPVRTIERH